MGWNKTSQEPLKVTKETIMEIDHWCPQAQKMVTLTLEAVHKTRIGLEAGTVSACQNQGQCRHYRREDCLVGKTLEGRFP